jgi:hypothetical protein
MTWNLGGSDVIQTDRVSHNLKGVLRWRGETDLEYLPNDNRSSMLIESIAKAVQKAI